MGFSWKNAIERQEINKKRRENILAHTQDGFKAKIGKSKQKELRDV